MDLATLAVDVVIALWITAVIVAVARAWQSRMPRLAPLAPEAQGRYRQAWENVMARFISAPRESVRQADSLVTSVLRDRGHPLDYVRLPRQMIEARRKTIDGEERGQTEPLRQALLAYRAVFEQALGGRGREKAPDRRREMA